MTTPTVQLARAFSRRLLPDKTGRIPTKTRYLILTGGRGSGKSFAISLCLSLAIRSTGYSVLFTRWTMSSAHDSIIPEFKEKIDLLRCPGEYHVTRQDIQHALGSRILFRGIKTSSGNQTAKLKSLQGLNAWILDEAEEMPDEKTFDVIDLSIRDPRRPNLVILCMNPVHKRHWIYRRFWEGRGIPDIGYNGVKGDATYIHTDYRDNKAHLPANYLHKAEEAKKGDPRRYKSVWLGSWMEEVIGALWSWSMISDHRVEAQDVPELIRVGVGVDPNVSYGEDADEAGIVSGGQGKDGHYYILNDASGQMGPADWGRVAVQEFDQRKADKVIGEINQGGALVQENVEKFRPHIPFLAVNASRGKIIRADPIATLYAQGMVHHVGRFPELESEMMSYVGPSQASPNRMDAMVHLMHWLAQILPGDEAGIETAGFDRNIRDMGEV